MLAVTHFGKSGIDHCLNEYITQVMPAVLESTLLSRRKKSATMSESKAPSIGKDSNDPGSLSLGERKTKERKERLAKVAAEKA